METNFLAQLYTSREKYSVDVTVNDTFGTMHYYDPEQGATVIFGKDATLLLLNHGWVFSHFFVTDAKSSPPLWRHKLTFYRAAGKTISDILAGWGKQFQT
jgi:hypothetical protein